MPLRSALLLTCLPLSALASAGVCVSNGTGETLLFVAQANGAPQVSAVLDPAQTLCSGAGTLPDGVVRVFTDAGALEGCSRLVPDGATETLLDYADFDNCHWSSHDR